jgi:hypothetical protein
MAKLCPVCYTAYDDTNPCACSGHAPLQEVLDQKAFRLAVEQSPPSSPPEGDGILGHLTSVDMEKIVWLKDHGVMVKKVWRETSIS